MLVTVILFEYCYFLLLIVLTSHFFQGLGLLKVRSLRWSLRNNRARHFTCRMVCLSIMWKHWGVNCSADFPAATKNNVLAVEQSNVFVWCCSPGCVLASTFEQSRTDCLRRQIWNHLDWFHWWICAVNHSSLYFAAAFTRTNHHRHHIIINVISIRISYLRQEELWSSVCVGWFHSCNKR